MNPFPAPDRYEHTDYRRCGRTGLRLPPIGLGLWHNFGSDGHLDASAQTAIVHRAIDRGVTYFDLANNYGPPPGSAEENFGRLLRSDLKPLRDEIVIATKAGYDMWDGPYGDGGSRKYLLASLDQSLTRLGVDYVDIFYHHRPDPDTPLEESMGALATAVNSGRALYAGVSNYSPEQTEQAAAILADLGVPLAIHQPSYSMFNRHVEAGLLAACERLGIGMAVFSPLQQGLLTDRYLHGVPETSRAHTSRFLSEQQASDATYLERVHGLNAIAEQRGQTLAQLALAWVLRQDAVTTAIVGASSPAQLDANLDALTAGSGLHFTAAEFAAIDEFAVDGTGRR